MRNSNIRKKHAFLHVFSRFVRFAHFDSRIFIHRLKRLQKMFQKCENNFLRTSRNGENILIFFAPIDKILFLSSAHICMRFNREKWILRKMEKSGILHAFLQVLQIRPFLLDRFDASITSLPNFHPRSRKIIFCKSEKNEKFYAIREIFFADSANFFAHFRNAQKFSIELVRAILDGKQPRRENSGSIEHFRNFLNAREIF